MYVLPPPKGRRPAPPAFSLTRELVREDIEKLWEPGSSVGQVSIKQLRYNHHVLAKAVASGKSLLECSRMTGLGPGRISVLKGDPAFQELVSYYSEELHEIYSDVHSQMAAFGTSVLEELQERFEEAPEKFTKRELMDIFTVMADRSIPSAKGGPAPVQPSAAHSPIALNIAFVQGATNTEPPPSAGGGENDFLPPKGEQAPAALGLTGSVELPTIDIPMEMEIEVPPKAEAPTPLEWKRKKLKEALERAKGGGDAR